jgi:hypothetical protein
VFAAKLGELLFCEGISPNQTTVGQFPMGPYYHGTYHDYEKPKLNGTLGGNGIFWLALEKEIAAGYSNPWYKPKDKQSFIWEIYLKPGTKIIDLNDTSNPVIDEIRTGVGYEKEYWETKVGFGILEHKEWIVRFLRQKRVDAVFVKNDRLGTGVTEHSSLALLNLKKIESISRTAI